MIIYGDTNAKVSHNRLKWNIKVSSTAPTSSTEGQIGDVIIVSSNPDLEKKIKRIATKSFGDLLQDNSINIYEDFNQNRILVNQNNGFNMYLQANQQNVMVDGEIVVVNVFFYDALTNEWVQYASAYQDALNVNSFTGQNIDIEELWCMPTFIDSVNEESLLPTMIRQIINDSLTIASFVGSDLDVDIIWAGPTITDSASLRTSSFEENEDIEIN